MRVGVIGPMWPDSLADNIVDCLGDLAVTPVALGPAGPDGSGRLAARTVQTVARFGAETVALVQRPLLRRAREAACDVIINVDQSLVPQIVAGLKRTAAQVVLWYPDSMSNIGRSSMIAGDYDALFLKDRLFADRLRSIYCMPAHYLPEACNPRWHRPIGEPGGAAHIAVAGNMYPTRVRLLRRLHAAGIPLQIYGSGFPRWLDPGPLAALHTGRFVTRQDKARVFREARGVLNNLHPAEMDSANCRLFEAAGSGAAVLCERRGVLADLFRVGEEVLAFDAFDELVEQCSMLLDKPEAGRRIGDAASARALGEHTYQQRLRVLLDLLG